MKCKYCKSDATKGVIWADGRARIPVCEDHIQKAKDKVADNNDSVSEIQNIESSTMNRVVAELVTRAALVVAAEDPNSYKKRVGRCPRGYRFDGDKCTPSGGGGQKKKSSGKDKYKLDKKVREAKSLGDIPNGFAGIKDTFGAQLGITKYPPKDIDPKTIKIDLSGDADSHAVMTWKDKKGRTQAAYSNTFKKRNAAKKWERVKKLEKKYDKAVTGFEKQLAKGKTPRERDAAAAMLLIAKTGLRPGGESHLKASGHRGIGTLSPENVTVDGDTIKLKFIGKSGKENNATLTDPNLAKYLKGRLADPASEDRLFATKDADLSKAMKKSGLGQFKPKDFRTRQAGQLASDVLSKFDDPPPLPEGKGKAKKLIKQRIAEAAKAVSDALNNTPSVAKSSYINPAIIQGWLKLIGGEQYAAAAAGDEKLSADEIFKTALDVTLPGHDQDATPLDEEDPQLDEDPIPLA